MISLSSIKEYMFCPFKSYLRHNLDDQNENSVFQNKTIKQIRIDVNDLIARNIRGLKIEMSFEDIEHYLKRNIDNTIKSSLDILKEKHNSSKEDVEDIRNEINDETDFLIDILSLKALKSMKSLGIDGQRIAEMFFPTAMYNYLIRDTNLEIIGACDKIEINDGRYYPINIKTSNPPIQGVWDGDAIELVANAMLIEQEFDTEVFVGFIDYVKICQRRPVVMDSKLRKSFFKVIHEIKEIIDEENVPDINFDTKKCSKCFYFDVCNIEKE